MRQLSPYYHASGADHRGRRLGSQGQEEDKVPHRCAGQVSDNHRTLNDLAEVKNRI